MNEKTQDRLILVARILMAILFLLSGISKITGFDNTVSYIASKGLPLPPISAIAAIVVEVGGSIALIAGFHTRLAAFFMAVFTLGAAVSFHNFWALPPSEVVSNQVSFLKNISITGGLLMFVVFGSGGLSVDSRRKHQ
jgi:putative oxidoreductase